MTSSNSSPPLLTKGQRTEAAFIDAARRTFAEKGYFNTKISDIAAAAGKSSGSFYNYWKSKEDLLTDLVDRFASDVAGRILQGKGDDPLENIRAAVRVYWESYREHLAEMVGLFQMSMLDERFRERWVETRAIGIREVIRGVRAAEGQGIHSELDEEALASAIVTLLEGYCYVWLGSGAGDAVTRATDDVAIETLSQIWYRSLFARPAT